MTARRVPVQTQKTRLNADIRCWCGSTAFSSTAHLQYVHCSQCGSAVLLRPDILSGHATDEQIVAFYDSSYWDRHQSAMGLPSISARARRDIPERCLHWLASLLKYCPPPARVLELGCAHGGFVKLLAAAGYQAVGVEMDPDIIDRARRWFEVEVIQGPVELLSDDIGLFDVIAAFDVMEHLPRPTETLARLMRMLAPGGMLLVQTPEYSINRAPDWPMFLPPEHVFLFRRESFQMLLARFGLHHVVFEPPMFSCDFMAFACRQPLAAKDPSLIQSALEASGSGRLVLAMLDLRDALSLHQDAESTPPAHTADRSVRRAMVNLLRRALPHVIRR